MADLRTLQPWIKPHASRLYTHAAANGWNPRVTSVRRTRATQARYYREYLRGNWPLPVAPPGSSLHELGLAFDLVTTPQHHLAELGRLWTSWGFRWGGKGDPVHFDAGNRRA